VLALRLPYILQLEHYFWRNWRNNIGVQVGQKDKDPGGIAGAGFYPLRRAVNKTTQNMVPPSGPSPSCSLGPTSCSPVPTHSRRCEIPLPKNARLHQVDHEALLPVSTYFKGRTFFSPVTLLTSLTSYLVLRGAFNIYHYKVSVLLLT